jgi:LPXTG-motif cell wall-anchored protein
MKKFMIGLGVAALSLGITAPASAGSGGSSSASSTVLCRDPDVDQPPVTVTLPGGTPGEGLLVVTSGATTLIDQEVVFSGSPNPTYIFNWPAGAVGAGNTITITVTFGSDPGVLVNAGSLDYPGLCNSGSIVTTAPSTAPPTTDGTTTTTDDDDQGAGGPTLPAVTTTPATPTTQSQSGGPLPQTGTSVDTIIQVGALLAVGGLLVVIATRRRSASNAA